MGYGKLAIQYNHHQRNLKQEDITTMAALAPPGLAYGCSHV
jgi:hypothetical protein